MLHGEIIWSLQNDVQAVSNDIKRAKNAIKGIIIEIGNDIKSFGPVKKRNF